MAEQKEKPDVGQNQPTGDVSEFPNRDKFLSNLRKKHGEDKSDEELYDLAMSGYDTEHEANKRYNDEANTFAEIVNSNPDLAIVFNEIFERGKDGNPELALLHMKPNFKRLMTDNNYGSDEYLAEKERLAKEESDKSAKDSQIQKLREQAFDEVCQEDNIQDPDAALKALKDIFNNPCETLEQCKEQLRSFMKMASYDAAVQAAEVRGKNGLIQEQRRNVPQQGAPNNGTGASQQSNRKSIYSDIADNAKKMREIY
mgnify:CR=1 FL=1